MWGGTSFTGLTSLANELITDAEAEVNKHLSQRYDISQSYFQTTSSVPPLVRKITKWLAVGYLFESQSRGSKETFKRADRYIKRAMDNLKEIKEYKAGLLNTAGSAISDSTDDLIVESSTQNYSSTFNEDDPLNWDVDQDKIDDIASERS